MASDDIRTVTLSTPIEGVRGLIREISFRAPRFDDYMDFGDPETLVGLNAGDAGFFQEDIAVIRKYIERLATDDFDINFLPKLGLKDTLAVKEMILSFFRDATRKTENPSSTESRENSSSDMDSRSGPSTI